MLEALQSVKQAVQKIKANDALFSILQSPERVVELRLPLRRDKGKVVVYRAFRVQWNSALGPYKGGIRYHESVSREEVELLALLMTLKCSLMGLPYGGGKAGVIVNPKELSSRELEALTRALARGLADMIGEHKDVPAPDVGTTPEIMRWFQDEYARMTGNRSLAIVTGKPLNRGGSQGRTEATGYGGFIILKELLKIKNKKSKIKNAPTIALQGFGNVGYYFAREAYKSGYRIIAISDSTGGIVHPKSLDPDEVMKWKEKHGSVKGFPGTRTITQGELLTLPCDVLVPAALENQITNTNVAKVRAKVVLELANGPVASQASKKLWKKGIPVVPDILANGGGVTVSFFEWKQNLLREHWAKKAVLLKLETYMKRALAQVIATQRKYHTDMREASYIVAVSRIAKALKEKGVI